MGLRMGVLRSFSVNALCHLNNHFVYARFLPWGFPFVFAGLNALQCISRSTLLYTFISTGIAGGFPFRARRPQPHETFKKITRPEAGFCHVANYLFSVFISDGDPFQERFKGLHQVVDLLGRH
jgi:hypothetical protein